MEESWKLEAAPHDKSVVVNEESSTIVARCNPCVLVNDVFAVESQPQPPKTDMADVLLIVDGIDPVVTTETVAVLLIVPEAVW